MRCWHLAGIGWCRLLVRIDAAGCSARVAWGCRNRNAGFAVTARAADGIDTAIAAARFDDSMWIPATPNPKHARKPDRAQAADLLIRIPERHPAAQALLAAQHPR